MGVAIRWVCAVLVAACLALAAAGGRCEEEGGYRLRIQNSVLGPVEASADGGKSWLLVARVARPLGRSAREAGASLTTVLRTSPHGMALGLGIERVIKVLPDTAANRRDAAAILLNIPASGVFFRELLPPVGSPVQRVQRGQAEAWQPGYDPQDGDALLFVAPAGGSSDPRLADHARDAAERYLEMAIARLKGKAPTTGSLTVVAKLADGESPRAVTFLLDGAVRAIVNAAPFEVRWNTREWEDGEHLVEVRALDGNGAVLTQTRALVVVQNKRN